MPLEWRLAKILKDERLTPYALWRASGVSQPTVYRWARMKRLPRSLDLNALEGIVKGLRRLTGKDYQIGDLFAVVDGGQEEVKR